MSETLDQDSLDATSLSADTDLSSAGSLVAFTEDEGDRPEDLKLSIENLDKIFGAGDAQTVVLSDINLSVRGGDFCCLVGPSGCGKTTLLNVVAGFEKETSGRVIFDGEPINGPSAARGVVFQQGALFPWLSVLENVKFGPLSLGKTDREATSAAEHYLALVGLLAFGDYYPYQLSGGMQQRVGVARALVNEPDLLLMDEPFAALDQQTREVLQEELKKIWRTTGQTILLITHSIEEALFLGNRIVLMSSRPGRIKEQYRSGFAERTDLAITTTSEFLMAKRVIFEKLRRETMAAQAMELKTC